MRHVVKAGAKKFQNSPTVDVLEYPTNDPDIDGAVATVNGNYPDTGFVVNEECNELLYVISGEGTLVTKSNSANLRPGDLALIDKGELFRYESVNNLVLFVACTPAWTPGQHKKAQ